VVRSDRGFCKYGCETWALTFREENTEMVLEYGVLRIIFGFKRQEVTGS
jgi:hypothetical protein